MVLRIPRFSACWRATGCDRYCRARACFRKRLVQCSIKKIVHQPAFAKTHFRFRRMHVHVDCLRRNFQEQNVSGMTSMKKHVRICLANRVSNDSVAHETAIDVKILLIGLRTRSGRQSDPTRKPQACAMMIDAQTSRWKFVAENFGDASGKFGVARGRTQKTRRFRVVRQPEFNARLRQRDRLDQFVDMSELGALRAQEFPARGNIVEDVAHLDGAAARMLRRFRSGDLSVFAADAPCVCCVGGARCQSKTARSTRSTPTPRREIPTCARVRDRRAMRSCSSHAARSRAATRSAPMPASIITHANQPCIRRLRYRFRCA